MLQATNAPHYLIQNHEANLKNCLISTIYNLLLYARLQDQCKMQTYYKKGEKLAQDGATERWFVW